MASKAFSFRLPDEVVQFIESEQQEGETLNQTAQRLLIDLAKKNNPLTTDLSTTVYNLEELVDKRLEAGLAEVRSQLEELRGKSKAR
jgi:hypothetical protein